MFEKLSRNSPAAAENRPSSGHRGACTTSLFGGAAEASCPFLRLLPFPEAVENIERDGAKPQEDEKEEASGTGDEAEPEKDSQNNVSDLLFL